MRTKNLKKYLLVMICMLGVGVLFSSCGPSDYEMQGEIREKVIYSNPKVVIQVSNGIANLGGNVDSQEAKTSVVGIATAVKGIKKVNDNIEVIEYKPQAKENEELRAAIIMGLEEAKLTGIGVEVSEEKRVKLTGKASIAVQKQIMEVIKGYKTGIVDNEIKEK